MQRLFAMFPGAAPGAALVLLRVTVAATTAIDGLEPGASPLLAAVFAILAFAVLVGFLTPISASLAAFAELVLLLLATDFTTLPILLLLGPLDAVALALLGPGAYSLDARLFGRRVVVLHGHER